MIDVSNYQGLIDWPTVKKAGVERAYIKATEGNGFVDPMLSTNTLAARSANIQIGFYHFAHPTNSPLDEARHLLKATSGLVKPGDLAPALDLELAEGHSWDYLNGWKAQFMALIDDAIKCSQRYSTVFYSYFYFWKEMVLYPDRPVWGAGYGPEFVAPNTWSVHQYSSTGTVPGIKGHVDLDKVLKSLPTVK